MGSTYNEIDFDFDFELIVKENILPQIAETPSSHNTFGLGNFGKVDPKLRTVVCLYWLLGLCQKVIELFIYLFYFVFLFCYFFLLILSSYSCSIYFLSRFPLSSHSLSSTHSSLRTHSLTYLLIG